MLFTDQPARSHIWRLGLLLVLFGLTLVPGTTAFSAPVEARRPKRYSIRMPVVLRSQVHPKVLPTPTTTPVVVPTNTPVPTPTNTPVPVPTNTPVPTPATCAPIPGVGYETIWVAGSPTDRPAEAHADLNLALRGYQRTDAFHGLVDYGGSTDGGAPQLPGLFSDSRTPVFSSVYRVFDWNWSCNCRGGLIGSPPVTLAGLATGHGETLHLPSRDSGGIGDGYQALVLYASEQRITLKYTRDDNVVSGYTLHVENVCVDPNLLALYRDADARGRGDLPALRSGQPFGHARGGEIGVAIRDSGSFMDPRSRKDWWQGR
ncbi:MAG TPA: hypothetical protein VER55_02450 [Ardenticatenaceae bacterium]|nr:hypothetical protein [Ardenticatenaceae bacterium]